MSAAAQTKTLAKSLRRGTRVCFFTTATLIAVLVLQFFASNTNLLLTILVWLSLALVIYCWVRLHIDAVLFSNMSDIIKNKGVEQALTATDQWLAKRFKLPEHKLGRPLAARITGTRSLLRLNWFANLGSFILAVLICINVTGAVL